MSNAAWLKDKTKERDYNAKCAIAKDAYHAGCWVYSEKTKKLYTPREFVESSESIDYYRGEQNIDQFPKVDPRKWRYLIMENIKNQTEEAIMLEKRIDEYYDMTPRPKNKKPKFGV